MIIVGFLDETKFDKFKFDFVKKNTIYKAFYKAMMRLKSLSLSLKKFVLND